jgi:hypothetical protein
LRLGTDIYAHAVMRVQELAKAAEKVQVRVYLFIVQVLYCENKIH